MNLQVNMKKASLVSESAFEARVEGDTVIIDIHAHVIEDFDPVWDAVGDRLQQRSLRLAFLPVEDQS